jgi:hypothetical protein
MSATDKATECAREIDDKLSEFRSHHGRDHMIDYLTAVVRRHFPTPPLDVIREAVEQLERLEWMGYAEDSNHFACPVCRAEHPDSTKIPHHPNCKLHAALTRLRALLDGPSEGPTDKERLDWLEGADVTIQFNTMDCVRAVAPHFENGLTFRLAIDAAMKETRK